MEKIDGGRVGFQSKPLEMLSSKLGLTAFTHET